MRPDERPSSTAEWLSAIDRYDAGECTLAEAEMVQSYLTTHPEMASYVEAIRSAARPPRTLHFDPNASLRRLRRRLAVESRMETSPPPRGVAIRPRGVARGAARGTGRPISLRTGLIAAVIFVGAAAAALWNRDVVSARLHARAEMTEYATSRGQRATIHFSDGETVVLGPESRLRYTPVPHNGERTVWLAGEAYFDIRHDAARTLTVRTQHAVARVLGTTFVIKAYDNDATMQVAVAEGKVAVIPSVPHPESTILTGGHVGRFGHNGAVSTTTHADLDPYLGWLNGRLVFRGATLGAIARDLDRWCDIDIRFADPALASTVLAVSFRTTVVDDILATLTTTAGIRYTRTGRIVTLSR